MRWFVFTLLLLATQVLADSTATLTTDNGYIRQPMPGRTVTAGYLTLTNSGAKDVSLVSVTTDAFARAELHQHSHKDGMMRMEQVESIDIAAGTSVEMAPGGLHLMLFEASSELEIGQMVALQLHFSDGAQLLLTLPVKAMPKR
uniref:Copper metallochaperone, bacterial analog of Cox17 protein n=1 Tax=Rheinheimera sp. BAL341 TaxID=1708203 RepID=A0A486XL66_9GAMM